MGRKGDLKENALAAKLERGLEWAARNRATVFGVLALIVIGIPISSIFIIRNQEIKGRNWTRLAQAQSLIKQKQYDSAKAVLADIINSVPQTSVANHSAYYLGQVELTLKKYPEAIRRLSAVADQSAGTPLEPLALISLGEAYENAKSFPSAAQTYQRYMDHYAEHFMAPRTQLALGRSWALAGRFEAAQTALGQLIDLYPTSKWAEKARAIVDMLKTK